MYRASLPGTPWGLSILQRHLPRQMDDTTDNLPSTLLAFQSDVEQILARLLIRLMCSCIFAFFCIVYIFVHLWTLQVAFSPPWVPLYAHSWHGPLHGLLWLPFARCMPYQSFCEKAQTTSRMQSRPWIQIHFNVPRRLQFRRLLPQVYSHHLHSR